MHVSSAHETGLKSSTAGRVPVRFDGILLQSGLKLDLIVEDLVIIELKAVEKMLPLYDAQIRSYLKLAQLELGYLINFHVARIKEGIRRVRVAELSK